MLPLTTLFQISQAARAVAGRCIVRELVFDAVEIRVPAWHVRKVREVLEPHRPIGARFVVRRMSVGQHFTAWHAVVVDEAVN